MTRKLNIGIRSARRSLVPRRKLPFASGFDVFRNRLQDELTSCGEGCVEFDLPDDEDLMVLYHQGESTSFVLARLMRQSA